MILESLQQNVSDDVVESVSPMSDIPTFREWAKEEIVRYRRSLSGTFIGETFQHRGWPPEVVLAFLAAPIIKPSPGEIWWRLYGRR